jgi:hypothetical protein
VDPPFQCGSVCVPFRFYMAPQLAVRHCLCEERGYGAWRSCCWRGVVQWQRCSQLSLAAALFTRADTRRSYSLPPGLLEWMRNSKSAAVKTKTQGTNTHAQHRGEGKGRVTPLDDPCSCWKVEVGSASSRIWFDFYSEAETSRISPGGTAEPSLIADFLSVVSLCSSSSIFSLH